MNETATEAPVMRRGGTVYFDLTDLLQYARDHDHIVGIPRVVLRVVAHLVAKHRDRVRLIAWHPTRKAVFEIESSWCTPDYEFSRPEFARWFDLNGQQLYSIEKWVAAHYRGRWWHRAYHTLRARLFAALGHEAFFRKRNIDLERWVGTHLRMVAPRSGDSIVIMGAVWNFATYMDYLQSQKRRGIRIVLFVHDLIPILFPEHTIENIPHHFEQWLDTMSRLAAMFLTNSESTRRDLQAELDKKGARQSIRVVPLAHEFVVRNESLGARPAIRAEVRSSARLPFVLCVGTIESRKNPWGLARVWARLIEEIGFHAPRLVLAGSSGWHKDDFDEYMRATGYLGGMIRIVERPSEDELAFLYSKCLFTVLPSYYEGWGLPIGESLWFGKTCVTSTTSSMPEVGSDMCAYADPNDLDSVFQAVRKMIVDSDHRAGFEGRIRRDRLRTWERVSADLWSAIIDCGDALVPDRVAPLPQARTEPPQNWLQFRAGFRDSALNDDAARVSVRLWPPETRELDLQIVVVSGERWSKARATLDALTAELGPRTFLTMLCGEADSSPFPNHPQTEMLVFPDESVFQLRARVPSLLKETGWVAVLEDHGVPQDGWLASARRAIAAASADTLAFTGVATNETSTAPWHWANFLFNFAYHWHPSAAVELKGTVATTFFRRDLVGTTPLDLFRYEEFVLGRWCPVDNDIRVNHTQYTGWWLATIHVFDNGLVAGNTIRRTSPTPLRTLLRAVSWSCGGRLREIRQVLRAHPRYRELPRGTMARIRWIALCHGAGAILGSVLGSGRAHKRLE